MTDPKAENRETRPAKAAEGRETRAAEPKVKAKAVKPEQPLGTIPPPYTKKDAEACIEQVGYAKWRVMGYYARKDALAKLKEEN